MRYKSVWLVLLLVLCFMPDVAFADEVNPLDGLGNALSTWTGQTVETVDYEREFIDSYEPVYVTEEPRIRSDFEEETTMGSISGVVDTVNTVPVGSSSSGTILWAVRTYFNMQSGRALLAAAVGVVFMWWGVRKSVRMVFAAFRKGRSNV